MKIPYGTLNAGKYMLTCWKMRPEGGYLAPASVAVNGLTGVVPNQNYPFACP
jgi:hypothetical protein